jgi:SAM-dependent methyltransferase
VPHSSPEAEYQHADLVRMGRARKYAAWQRRLVAPWVGRRVLEYGCGLGNFTAALLDREIVVACDTEPSFVDALRQRFPDRANLYFFPGDTLSPEFPALSRHDLDSCVCLNVLEHIEDDHQAIQAIAAILKPPATVVLLVPAFPALYGPIDRRLRHARRYKRKSLVDLAHSAGLQVRHMRYVNSIGFLGWWINARILRLEEQSPGQIEIFDRWIVPLISRVERVVPPPFGQSLLAVLEKGPNQLTGSLRRHLQPRISRT